MRSGGQLAVRAEVLDRDFGVVGHASEHHRLSPLKSPQPGLLAIVPFAGAKGHIAVFVEQLGHQFCAGERLGVHMEPGSPAHQHRPAGHANRAAVSAKDVIAPKAESRVDQLVQVGSFYVRVAPGANGVSPLVVGEQEKNVRTAIRSCRVEIGKESNRQKQLDSKKEKPGANPSVFKVQGLGKHTRSSFSLLPFS